MKRRDILKVGVAASLIPLMPAVAVACAPKTFYGINLHPLYPIYQSLGTAPVIAFMNDLGMKVGRMDFYDPSQTATAVTWCSALQNAGMLALPILIASHVDGDETTSYNNGHALGVAMANALHSYTNVYEMGNELDDYCKYTADGLIPSCYPEAKWIGCRGVMRGVYDGVKSVQPTATLVFAGQTVLCEGFTNGMFQGVDPSGNTGGPIVHCDSLAWHWYGSSGNILNTGSSRQPAPCGSPNGGLNILAFTSSFNKGVWLTEIGASGGDTDAQQSSYVTLAMNRYYTNRNTYGIQSVCWYELINTQPTGSSYNFGLVQSNGTTKRPAYTTMKNFIAANPA